MTVPNAAITASLIYLALVVGLSIWKLRALKGREGRRPVGEDVKLMRQPGEALRRKITELDEQVSDRLMMLLAVPVVAAWVPLGLARVFTQTHAFGWLLSAGALFALSIVVCLRRLTLVAEQFRNYRLGLAGERFVADNLAELAIKGYAIFHDVPCQGARGMFNLDHVVVGGGGVAVIETKTRRKKTADEGSKKNPVTYDGMVLDWPCGFRDHESVKQAVGNARWLKTHLQENLNIRTEPLPVLTIPGWWVEAKAREPIAALNPLTLAAALPARMAKTLSAAETDQIVRNLAKLCRDVDFNDPV